MPDTTAPTKATFTPIGSNNQPDTAREVKVHFNPATLQYEVSNTLAPTKSGKNTQYVSKSSAKLSMELTFDGTLTGADVRNDTQKLAQFMEPRGSGQKAVPAVVQFTWGSFSFRGMVDSYRETFNFFSSTGVPLRSTVSLSLSRQDKVFNPQSGLSGPRATPPPGFKPSAVQTSGAPPPPNTNAPTGSAGDVAGRAGDGRAARALGAANGQESLRFGTGDGGLIVSDEAPLRGPVAFASAGAGVSASAGAGASAGLGASAGAFASAGASATAGSVAETFGELRVQGTQAAVSLSPENLLPQPPGVGLDAGAGASFSLGGQADAQGDAGLRADVGAGASLKGKITFDE